MCMSCSPRRDSFIKTNKPQLLQTHLVLSLWSPPHSDCPHLSSITLSELPMLTGSLFCPSSLTVHPWPCPASLFPCLSSGSLFVCLSLFLLSLSAGLFSTVSLGICLAICVLCISVPLFLSRPFSPPILGYLGCPEMSLGHLTFSSVEERFCSRAA